ncbi:MAG: T9SS type A sorting domain-containing protein [Flavobacteriales bacterium]|nr:T9SS type A sorting domain-containing protein [Flavobacteriales bacterium]
MFAIRFASESGTWSVPVTRQFTSTASLDTDGDGLCDALDPCPLLANLVPGNSCDDGSASTFNDMVTVNCICAGTLLNEDCEGNPGGPAQPGTSCDDGDDCTVNDVYDSNCDCAGTFADADDDGTCDAEDECPGGPEPGTACDDGNNLTVDDEIQSNCSCIGTPTSSCTTDIDFVYQADGNDDFNWAIYQQSTNLLMQFGGGALIGSGSQGSCLPDGCFYLVVTDDGGDGIVGGGYILKINSAQRPIDNRYDEFARGGFTSGQISQIAGGEGFCLPIGTDRLITSACDRHDWRTTCTPEYVVANDNPAVGNFSNSLADNDNGYQMWWYNPNGGYSYKRIQKRNVNNGLSSANRATSFRINTATSNPSAPWAAINHLQDGVLYNVKVRGIVNNVPQNWGPACRFMINNAEANCPRTKLYNQSNAQFLSCGVTKAIASNVYVYANPVRRLQPGCSAYLNANRYQFRFRIPTESFELIKTSATGQYLVNTVGLSCGKTYEVDVRASFDNGATWCHTGSLWGDVCLLSTPNCVQGGGNQNIILNGAGHSELRGTKQEGLSLYPNPNAGNELFVNLTGVDASIETVSVDIYDAFGKRVSARTIAVNGEGFVNTIMQLNGELAAGLYTVSITAGEQQFTERLVVQP